MRVPGLIQPMPTVATLLRLIPVTIVLLAGIALTNILLLMPARWIGKAR